MLPTTVFQANWDYPINLMDRLLAFPLFSCLWNCKFSSDPTGCCGLRSHCRKWRKTFPISDSDLFLCSWQLCLGFSWLCGEITWVCIWCLLQYLNESSHWKQEYDVPFLLVIPIVSNVELQSSWFMYPHYLNRSLSTTRKFALFGWRRRENDPSALMTVPVF